MLLWDADFWASCGLEFEDKKPVQDLFGYSLEMILAALALSTRLGMRKTPSQSPTAECECSGFVFCGSLFCGSGEGFADAGSCCAAASALAIHMEWEVGVVFRLQCFVKEAVEVCTSVCGLQTFSQKKPPFPVPQCSKEQPQPKALEMPSLNSTHLALFVAFRDTQGLQKL